MLICKRANIAFVQIPKNGSKSVRQALLTSFGLDHGPVARDRNWTVEEFEAAYARDAVDYIPGVENNLDHLTLAVYRELLPQAYAAFRAAHSFALIREPRERFLSALLQRLGQFQELNGLRVDDPVVGTEARHVCEWLDGRGIFNDRTYIHFARQVDYVDLEGERLVDMIFPIERTDAAEAWIEGLTGERIAIAHEHARREPKKLGKVLYPSLRRIGRSVIPPKMRDAVHPIWRNSPLFDNAAKRYAKIDLSPAVEQFIQHYYAADFALYREARAQRGGAPAIRAG